MAFMDTCQASLHKAGFSLFLAFRFEYVVKQQTLFRHSLFSETFPLCKEIISNEGVCRGLIITGEKFLLRNNQYMFEKI